MQHTGQAARVKMEEYLANAQARSEASINRIMTETPRDLMVRGDALEFAALMAKPLHGGLGIEVSKPFRANVHDNFTAQYADKAGIGLAYLKDLGAIDAQWSRDLSAHVMTEHAKNALQGSRNLVRGVPGQVRAFLSDKFRRIDCRPGLEALIDAAQRHGAVVSDAVVSDIRASVRVLLPRTYEVGAGEFVLFGLSWSNSDYGRGAQDLSVIIIRLWCLNGAVLAKEIRQVHLGARLSDDLDYSDRTYRLDAAATTSAIRDTAKALLDPARVDETIGLLRQAAEAEIDPKAKLADIRKRLGKGLADRVGAAFNMPDVEALPPGNTAWRWSNAISWVAKQEDVAADDRLDLERAAGDAIRAAA